MTKKLNDPIMLIMMLVEMRLKEMHGYTLCFHNLLNMNGKRVTAIEHFDPTLGAKSYNDVRAVDIHGGPNEKLGLVFLDNAADALSGDVRGVGYVRDENQTDQDLYVEMAEDAYKWLINGIHPDIPLLH